MSDQDQVVGSLGLTQQWIETSTGRHARLVSAALVAQTTASDEVLVVGTTGGRQYVELNSGTITMPDGASNNFKALEDAPGNQLWVSAAGYLFNEATWDRPRSNSAVTVLASTTRTANTNSTDQINYNARAHILHVAYDTSTGASLTPTLQVKDSVSGLYNTVWTAAATVASTSTSATLYSYLIDPSASTASTGFRETARVRMGRTWRLAVTHSSSGATLYSASVDNLV